MPKSIVLFIFIGINIGAYGQESSVYNLEQVIKTTTNDSLKAAAMNRLAFAGNDYGFDAKSYVDSAYWLGDKRNIRTEKAKALLIKSEQFSAGAKYDSALIQINKALEIFPHTDSLKQAHFYALYYFCAGMLSLPQGDDKEETLDNFLKALRFSLLTADTYTTAACYGAVATVYNYLRQFDRAIEINNEFVDFAQKQKADNLILAKAYNNLAAAYQNAGKKEEAATYHKKFRDLLPSLESPYMQWIHVYNSAYTLMENGDIKEAIKGARHAISLAEAKKLPAVKILSSKYLTAYLLTLNKEWGASNQVLEDMQKLAAEAGSKEYQMYAYSNLADNFRETGNYKLAYEYINRQMALSDSITSEKTKINANYLTIKYQTAQKEAQIKLQQAQLKQKSTFNYILIGGAVALLLISLLGYRSYHHKQKLQQARIDELETEKQLTATEAVLKGEEQERTRLAKDLHDGLGGMLSGIKHSLRNMKENLVMTPGNAQAFERSMDMLDSSIKEMRRVAHNMMPEMLLKYGLNTALKEFCSEVDRSGAIHANYQSIGMNDAVIEQTIAVTVYRIVQELVNNAIKHAAAGNVVVQLQLSEQDKLLSVTVEDDGKGFDTALLKQSGGMGWSNIQNRVEFLKGKLDIQSAPGKGTSVLIEINT